jgi:hypothetical protein
VVLASYLLSAPDFALVEGEDITWCPNSLICEQGLVRDGARSLHLWRPGRTTEKQ